jgi:histidinol-phosphate aminotransferase
LTDDLEFDYENMPLLHDSSVMIITSPNNPTGNSIDVEKLKDLLEMYPQSLIILDGVYTEFCQDDVTPLVHQYPNLIVLRSFSKAFPIAGLRLGYLCAAPVIASIVKKLILQFSITPFSLTFAREMLFDEAFMEDSKNRVQEIIEQREIMSRAIAHRFSRDTVKVFPSEGNFLLIKIQDQSMFSNLMEDLTAAGIKVLNTSSFKLLQNTFRVSIGSEMENEAFLQCMTNSIESNFYSKFMLN